eukprot:jgi/Mesvir1/618/Mv02049-RA.1
MESKKTHKRDSFQQKKREEKSSKNDGMSEHTGCVGQGGLNRRTGVDGNRAIVAGPRARSCLHANVDGFETPRTKKKREAKETDMFGMPLSEIQRLMKCLDTGDFKGFKAKEHRMKPVDEDAPRPYALEGQYKSVWKHCRAPLLREERQGVCCSNGKVRGLEPNLQMIIEKRHRLQQETTKEAPDARVMRECTLTEQEEMLWRIHCDPVNERLCRTHGRFLNTVFAVARVVACGHVCDPVRAPQSLVHRISVDAPQHLLLLGQRALSHDSCIRRLLGRILLQPVALLDDHPQVRLKPPDLAVRAAYALALLPEQRHAAVLPNALVLAFQRIRSRRVLVHGLHAMLLRLEALEVARVEALHEPLNLRERHTKHVLDGGISCLSGRTAAYRRNIFTPQFKHEFTSEFWMGRKLLSGDDEFLTMWVVKNRWKTALQSHEGCLIQTTFCADSRFLKQAGSCFPKQTCIDPK